jgi:hypothetical protein
LDHRHDLVSADTSSLRLTTDDLFGDTLTALRVGDPTGDGRQIGPRRERGSVALELLLDLGERALGFPCCVDWSPGALARGYYERIDRAVDLGRVEDLCQPPVKRGEDRILS